MYTEKMRHAVRSLNNPAGIGLTVMDNENFLTVIVDELDLQRLSHDDKISAAQYMIKVKHVLEAEGAIVMLTRRGKDE
jgi:hypothetical protein